MCTESLFNHHRALSNLPHFAWDKLQIQTHPNFPHEEICKLEKKFPSLKRHYSSSERSSQLYCCGALVSACLLIYASSAEFPRAADAEKKAGFLFFAIFSRVHNVLLLYRFRHRNIYASRSAAASPPLKRITPLPNEHHSQDKATSCADHFLCACGKNAAQARMRERNHRTGRAM